ncbi:MAG: hypothetical protein HAW66_02260, partial [Shewanella sp.]|nr:hypothetical protein [Shewanella sp.]
MKQIVIGGLAASVLLGLTACGDNKSTEQKLPAEQTQTATAVQQALTSGVDFANF